MFRKKTEESVTFKLYKPLNNRQVNRESDVLIQFGLNLSSIYNFCILTVPYAKAMVAIQVTS